MSYSETKGLHFSFGHELPVILQSEMTECGLACIAMVLNYHNHHIDLLKLRHRFPTSQQGTTLENVIDIFDQLQLASRALKLELEEIRNLSVPCILHWDMNHFVVLKEVRGRKVVIHDPARGRITLSLEEVGQHFTGVALETHPTKAFKAKEEKARLGLLDVIKPISGLKRSLFQIFILSIAIQIFALLSPYFTQLVVDKVLPASDTNLLFVLGVGFITLAIVHTLVDNLRNWVVLYLGSTLSLQVVSRFMRHMLALPLDFFEKRHLGDIASRFGSLDEIQKLLTTGFVQGVVDGIIVITTLVLMLVYSVKLSFIAIAAIILFALLQFGFYRMLREHQESVIVMGAKKDSIFLETIRAMQPLKVFGREAFRHNVWLNRYTDFVNAGIKLGKLEIGLGVAHGIIAGCEAVILVWLAGYEMMNNQFSVGMFFAFMAYSTRFSGQAKGLVGQIFQFKMLSLHLERLADIALTSKERHLDGDDKTNTFSGAIELDKVGFRYSDQSQWVLRNIGLHIEKGECIAIAGPSGCGKTTLIKVIMGLLSLSEGKMLVDGRDIGQVGLRNYRGFSAAVMQDDNLLSGSIMDNICFFEPNPDIEHMHTVAEAAGILGDIENMPMAFQTLIGEMGIALSGGQKQRLLLARALYRNPSILFLDEATSHLDVEMEKAINHVISSLGITRIMVAHRQETIDLADRVIYLPDLNTQQGPVDS